MIPASNAATDATRQIARQLFDAIAAGAAPERLAGYFREDIDWHIAGDEANVPWIGRKLGREGVAEFYRQIRERVESVRFEVTDILAQDARAMVLGRLQSRVMSTGKLIDSEFAFDLTVEDGQIVRFRMFEDSFAVAQAAV